MPAVSQVGKLPGGGAFGLKHRKHAVTGGRIANAIPYVAMAPPYTNGTFDSIAASLIRKRVSRLSVPSTTTSTPFRISRTVAEWTSLETGSIWIAEFTERTRSAAASAFGRTPPLRELRDPDRTGLEGRPFGDGPGDPEWRRRRRRWHGQSRDAFPDQRGRDRVERPVRVRRGHRNIRDGVRDSTSGHRVFPVFQPEGPSARQLADLRDRGHLQRRVRDGRGDSGRRSPSSAPR